MSRLSLPLALVLGLSTLSGCKLKDALDGGPQTSYCEALCDWAAECAAADRGADLEALKAECLAATEAVSAGCADATKGELDAASSAALTECTDAIAEKQAAGECDGFTGLEAEVQASVAPVDCGTQDNYDETYTAAQDSVVEDGAELCERVTDTFCGKLDSCIQERSGEFDYSAIGVSPYDTCMSTLDGRIQECASNGDYDRDVANPQREAALECMSRFDELTCDDLFSGNLPAICAGAFVDPTDYAGSLLDIAQQYAL
jgi:hypothetical protein